MTYDTASLCPHHVALNNMSEYTIHGWHASCIVNGTSNHDWELYNTSVISLRCVKAMTDGDSL